MPKVWIDSPYTDRASQLLTGTAFVKSEKHFILEFKVLNCVGPRVAISKA